MAKIKKKYRSYRSYKKTTAFVVLSVVFVYLILALVFKFWPLHKHITITAPSVKNSLPSYNAKNPSTHTNSTGRDGASQTVNDNPKFPTQSESDTKTLISPSGTFVNLYDANANTQMNSICNTTAGAACQIIFTDANVSVALPVKTADSGGAATWAWTPQQIGLTRGSWHVTAKATLGSQTKTTDNGSLELVIQ